MKDFSLVVKNLGTWSQNKPSFLYKMRYCHHSVAHNEIYRRIKSCIYYLSERKRYSQFDPIFFPVKFLNTIMAP